MFGLKWLNEELSYVLENDPAARNKMEVLLLYSGIHAIIWYKFSHFFYKHKWFFTARLLSQLGRFFTGIEIHPGAQIGRFVFIDHGMGVVIGETAVVGDYCVLFHGVTLGGTSSKKTKRHPTLGDHVIVGAGAKLLGNINIGQYCKIGANAVVVKDIPSFSTAVGVPARILRKNKKEDVKI